MSWKTEKKTPFTYKGIREIPWQGLEACSAGSYPAALRRAVSEQKCCFEKYDLKLLSKTITSDFLRKGEEEKGELGTQRRGVASKEGCKTVSVLFLSSASDKEALLYFFAFIIKAIHIQQRKKDK